MRKPATRAIKFEVFAEQWFEEYARPNLRKRVYAAIGHLRMDKITPRQIQAFVNSLSKDGANERTGKKGTYTHTTKTKKSQRSLKFSQSVMDLLREYKAEQDEEALKCGDKWVETDRLYTKWNGLPMQNGTPYFWLGEFCEKHDLPFYGLHSFRHLFASLLVNQGVDIVTVSGALGHSTITTTTSIYCHVWGQAQARAGDAIASVLDFKKPDTDKGQVKDRSRIRVKKELRNGDITLFPRLLNGDPYGN